MKDGLVRVHSGLTDVPVLLRASSDHWGLDSQVGIQTNLDHNPDFFYSIDSRNTGPVWALNLLICRMGTPTSVKII